MTDITGRLRDIFPSNSGRYLERQEAALEIVRLRNELTNARYKALQEAAEVAQKHALSEGWSHTSALRFRNCILALKGRV